MATRASRIVVCALILAVAPAATAFTLGVPSQPDFRPLDLPWGFSMTAPRIACGTHHCVVAWRDDNAPRGFGVYVSRIDRATGANLDFGGRWIGEGDLAGIACAGDDCLLASTESDVGSTLQWRVRLTPIDAESGAIGDPSPEREVPTQGHSLASLSCGDTLCLATWIAGTDSANLAVYATRIDPRTATSIDASPRAIAPPGTVETVLGTSCDASRCLVSWSARGMFHARRFDLSTDAVLDASDIVLDTGTGTGFALSACDVGMCPIVWSTITPEVTRVSIRRVDLATGSFVDATPDTFDLTTRDSPAVLECRANTCVLVLNAASRERSIATIRFRLANLEIIGADRLLLSAQSAAASIACHFDECVVGWADARSGVGFEPTVSRLDAAHGRFADVSGIAVGSTVLAPTPTCRSGRCLLEWSRIDQFPGIGGYAVDELPIDPATGIAAAIQPARIETGSSRHNETLACTVDGSCLLGFDWWSMGTFARRVPLQTGLVDPATMRSTRLSTSTVGRPSIACAERVCLAAWQERGDRGDFDLHAAWIDPAVEPLSPNAFTVSSALGDQVAPTVACDTERCVIAWQSAVADDWDLFGARFDVASQSRIDANDVPIASAPGAQWRARAACDGGWCSIVWEDMRNGHDSDIVAARWALDAVAPADPDGFVIASGATIQQQPTLACAGGRCLVAWHDLGAGTSDVMATRIDPVRGVVLEPAASLAPETFDERGVGVAAVSPGHYVVAFYQRDETAGTRLWSRTVSADVANGASCGADGDCASGTCANGTCVEARRPTSTAASCRCESPARRDDRATTRLALVSTILAAAGTSSARRRRRSRERAGRS